MFRQSILAALLLVGIYFNIFATATATATVMAWNYDFAAPQVYGVTNVPGPQVGLIVYDAETDKFKAKGPKSAADWRDLNSSSGFGIVNVSTAYANTVATAGNDIIFADAASAPFTITLPSAVGNDGKILSIKKTDTSFNVVTLDGNSSELIDGSAATTLNTKGESVQIVSDGANWQVISRIVPSEWVTTFTPTIGATTTAPTKGTVVLDEYRYRRVGDSLEIFYNYQQSAAGSSGAGRYLFPLPTGLFMDTSKLSVSTNSVIMVGHGKASNSSGGQALTSVPTGVYAYNSTNLFLSRIDADSSSLKPTESYVGAGSLDLSNPAVVYTFYARVPISGWN